MEPNQLQFLLTFYSTTQSEITRYRDREWATPGIFVAALGTVVGFIISNIDQVRSLWLAFDFILICLAFGNAYYTIFVHHRLIKQRNIRSRLEYLFELHKIKVDGKNLLPFQVLPPKDNKFCKDWTNGFWSHILPFIVFGFILCAFGFWLIHTCH